MNARRVLIAGCGYVGQAAADLFHAAGWQVEGWTKSKPQTERPYSIVAVDLTSREEVNARPGDFDAIVQCASTRGGDVDLYRRVCLEGARNLRERFARSTILFTSSTGVYAQTDGDWVTEESETKPTRPTARVLLEAEEVILNGSGIVARLAGIYGPDRSALLKKFLDGDPVIDDARFVNQVHRDDIASAIFHLLDRQSLSRQIYNVVDDNPILSADCYRWLAKHLGRPVSASARSTSERKRGHSNKRVSNGKLRALGWAPQYRSFAEGMEKSVLPAHATGLR